MVSSFLTGKIIHKEKNGEIHLQMKNGKLTLKKLELKMNYTLAKDFCVFFGFQYKY